MPTSTCDPSFKSGRNKCHALFDKRIGVRWDLPGNSISCFFKCGRFGMPNMTGLELPEKVRSSVRWTPLILMTGRPSERSENYFRKPCDGYRFLSLIDTLSQDLNS